MHNTNNTFNPSYKHTYKAKDIRVEIICGNGGTVITDRTNKWLTEHPDLDIVSIDMINCGNDWSYMKIIYIIKTE